MKVGHILIALPDKAEAARARLERMGIQAQIYPAIAPESLEARLAGMGLMRFGGGTIPRKTSDHGLILSHMGAVGMGRAMGWEWVGLWEEDVDGVAGAGWRDLALPADCGVLYLGGILWGSAEDYGTHLGDGLWRVDKPRRVISCTHAVMIHARAMSDVLNAYSMLSMTIDDLLWCACMRAQEEGKWSTCFVQPWLAWQIDRPETRPVKQ